MPQLGSTFGIDVNEAIEADKRIEDINPNCFSLPDGFKWDDLDLNNNDELMELYTLLNENYVEDDDNMFRFDYSPGFLKWLSSFINECNKIVQFILFMAV